jgi:8-oxo-dGTP diphosphatase
MAARTDDGAKPGSAATGDRHVLRAEVRRAPDAHDQGVGKRWHAAPMATEASAWRNSRPKKRMGAAVLIRDPIGRVLVVEPTYKATWELPGGAVEADESPRSACAREVAEELGLALTIGRLLCLEWQGPEPERSESLMFVYDGGVLTDRSRIRLPPDELASFRLAELDELEVLLVERLWRRTGAAWHAHRNGTVAELEWGVLVELDEPDVAGRHG